MNRTHPARRHRQRGVVTLEYALMLVFGLVPLLLLTYTGVMLMAVQQTLSQASAEGARASLRMGDSAQRRTAACMAAQRSMQWLLTYAGQEPDCSSANAAPIEVSAPTACAGLADAQCVSVSVSFDYRNNPFLPGTGQLYGWVIAEPLRSTAVAQLDLGSN